MASNGSNPKNHRFYDDDRVSSYLKKLSKESKKDEASNKDLKKEHGGFLNPWGSLKTTDRVQFQIEGHNGPQTYVFGFDTGRG